MRTPLHVLIIAWKIYWFLIEGLGLISFQLCYWRVMCCMVNVLFKRQILFFCVWSFILLHILTVDVFFILYINIINVYIYISVICDSPYHSLQILAHCCLANISKKANLLGPSLDTEDWMKHKSQKERCGFFSYLPSGWWLGGGNSNVFYFQPENWGRWTHFDSYFSDGLKPPTRWWSFRIFMEDHIGVSSGVAVVVPHQQ